MILVEGTCTLIIGREAALKYVLSVVFMIHLMTSNVTVGEISTVYFIGE